MHDLKMKNEAKSLEESMRNYEREFLGAANYDVKRLAKLPWEARPFYRVEYKDTDELRAAMSVAPKLCQVEFVFVEPRD